MNLDEILMLTSDEIDFTELSEENLEKLVLCEDLFIATSALGELSRRRSNLTPRLASKILSEHLGDRYLQATAFEALFATAPSKAADHIVKQVEVCDGYVLNSILEILLENVDFFSAEQHSGAVQAVADRLRGLTKGTKYPNPELVEQFRRVYRV